MAGNRIFLFFVLGVLVAGAARAETTLAVQVGYAYNISTEGYQKYSLTELGEAPEPVNAGDGYVALSAVRAINEEWALGIGTRLIAGDWPLSKSNAIWAVDLVIIEYQPVSWLALRGNFGVVKAYENKPAYGRQSGWQVLTPVAKNIWAGLGYINGPVDQEQGNNLDGPDLQLGTAEAYFAFLEWRH